MFDTHDVLQSHFWLERVKILTVLIDTIKVEPVVPSPTPKLRPAVNLPACEVSKGAVQH
jgi:hypothetical protein